MDATRRGQMSAKVPSDSRVTHETAVHEGRTGHDSNRLLDHLVGAASACEDRVDADRGVFRC